MFTSYLKVIGRYRYYFSLSIEANEKEWHVLFPQTVDTYYRKCSSVSYVANVSVPLLCISAIDDPVCTSEAIPWDECRSIYHFLSLNSIKCQTIYILSKSENMGNKVSLRICWNSKNIWAVVKIFLTDLQYFI